MSELVIETDESIESNIQQDIPVLKEAIQKAYNPTKFIIERLLSGFSGAVIVTGKPIVKAGQGQPKDIVMKIALEKDIKKENKAYNAFVCPYLSSGTFPLLVYKHTQTKKQCLIYELAFDERESIIELRELIQTVPDIAMDIISKIFKDILIKWYSNPSREYGDIGDYYLENRFREIGKIEEAFYKSIGVKIPERFYSSVSGKIYYNPFIFLKNLENLNLKNCRYLEVISHGDLNARNVLVDRKTQRINLIDFANTNVRHFCYDFAKLETVIVTELFSQLPFGKKLPVILMFVDKLELDDREFLKISEQHGLDHSYRELFLLVKTIRDSFINVFKMYQEEDLFKNYKVSLIYFLLKSLTYNDISRSDKILAFCEISSLISSILKTEPLSKKKKRGPVYAIEEIERMSPSFIKHLRSKDLDDLIDYTNFTRKRGNIGDLDFYLVRAKIKYSRGEWSSAFQEFQKLKKVSKDGSHMWYLSEAFLGIGLIEHVKGKIYIARDYFIKARDIKETHCSYDLEGLAQVHMRLGWGKEDIGEIQESISYYKKALGYARRSQELRVLVDALHDLGVAYWKDRELNKARELFEEGYDLASSVENHKMMAYHLLGLARVAWYFGDPTAANLFAKSTTLFREIKYKRGLALALTEYGDFLLSEGELKKSMTLLSEAKSINEFLGELRELYKTETITAANLIEREENQEDALELLTHARQGFENLGIKDVYKNRCEELLERIK